MKHKNILIICNSFPDKEDKYTGSIFVKEQVKFLTNFFDNVYVISPVAYGVELIRKTRHEDYSINKMHVYFPKYFNFPFFFDYFRDAWLHLELVAISNFIRKAGLKFDLIHAHFTWPSGAVAAYLKREFRVPLVITEHASNTFREAIEKKDPFFIRAWEESDIIIRVNSDDITLFSNVGISLDKIYYLPNGYDSSSFSAHDLVQSRKKLGLPLDKKLLLNVGNLYHEVKGHRYLIEAIGEVVKKRTDVLCVIIGSGQLRDKLKEQIKEAGLEAYVKLIGGKPHTEIPLWMNACDLFVLPSLNEANPTVLFECLGSGKPFIGTCVGNIPDIIVSDDYGLLAEPGNSKELAEVILYALVREWDCKKIIDYSISFSWEKITSKIVSIYNTVL